MDVAHQPVEDADVAMYGNVDIFQGLGVAQVLFEILHVGDQKVFVASEVLVELLVLVANVDDDLSSRLWNYLSAIPRIQRVNSLLLLASGFSSILFD